MTMQWRSSEAHQWEEHSETLLGRKLLVSENKIWAVNQRKLTIKQSCCIWIKHLFYLSLCYEGDTFFYMSLHAKDKHTKALSTKFLSLMRNQVFSFSYSFHKSETERNRSRWCSSSLDCETINYPAIILVPWLLSLMMPHTQQVVLKCQHHRICTSPLYIFRLW